MVSCAKDLGWKHNGMKRMGRKGFEPLSRGAAESASVVVRYQGRLTIA